MTTLKIGTWNLYEFGRHRDADARGRYELVAEALADELAEVDVLAVQEVCGRGRENLELLAERTGMSCWWDPPFADEDGPYAGRVAIVGTEPRPSDFHVGLLWRGQAVRARRDGFRAYPGGGEFWHGLVLQSFDVEGLDRALHVGSYHATPFAQDARPDEARRVASAMTRPYGAERLAIVGADWNSISADRIQDATGQWRYWHTDPYWSEINPNWVDGFGYQCTVTERTPEGLPVRWHADRRPGEVLRDFGCRDAAALAGAPWSPTTGHYPVGADLGRRVIDTHRVSPALAPAVVGWEVVRSSRTEQASDHLPVITELNLDRL